MNLNEYLAVPGFKYLVVGRVNWEADDVARSVAPEPRHFVLGETEYTIISLEPMTIPQLTGYMESQNGQYEFGWTAGNGKASYLTHQQMLDLLATLETEELE